MLRVAGSSVASWAVSASKEREAFKNRSRDHALVGENATTARDGQQGLEPTSARPRSTALSTGADT